MIDTETQETAPESVIPPPKKSTRKRSTAAPDAPQTLFFEEESEDITIPTAPTSEIAPWPAIGQWKAGDPASAQKIRDSEGWKYWNQMLTTPQRQYGTLYGYRLHPAMKKQLRHGRLVNPQMVKFSAEDGPITPELLLKRKGVGIYLIRMNQSVTKPACTVAMWEFEIRGSGNYGPGEMPIIDDMDQVDWNHPSNEDYRRICISRGIYKPPVESTPEGDEEMAASQTLGNIAERLISREIQQTPQQQVSNPNPVDIGVGKELVGLLREQINQNRPAGEQGTVLDMVTALSTLAKTNAPAPPDMAPFMELQRQNNELVRQIMAAEVARAQEDTRKTREELEAVKGALPKVKTVDEQWDELEKAAKRFERMTGRKRQPEGEDEPEGQSTAAAAGGFFGALLGHLPVIERIMSHGANMYYNFKLNGSGAPPLNPATQQPSNTPAPPVQTIDTEADEQPQQYTPEQQEYMNKMQTVVTHLVPLAQPMLNHLRQGKSGAVFARFVTENYGEAYGIVKAIPGGKQGLLNLLPQDQELWAQITALPQGLERFNKFLDEFLTYQATPVN